MKKIISLLMAAILVFSMAVPSFAAVSVNDAAQPTAISSSDATGTDDILSDVVDFFSGVFQSIVDFFKWLFGIGSDVAEYDVTYYMDSSKTVVHAERSYEAGSTIGTVPVPEKTGYTFIGWYPELPDEMPSQNLVVYATWSVKKYVITFDSDGGSPVSAMAVAYGEKIVLPAPPTKAGCEFLGWDEDYATMPAKNITLKALWGTKNTTITFDTDGGSTVEPITQPIGAAVTKPADPTKDGYDFLGWNGVVPEKQPEEDVTFIARWSPKEYTVTWIVDGKAYSDDYYFGEIITPSVIPSKQGYTAGNWTDDNGNVYVSGVTTMPAANVTYTLSWNPADNTPYTVETYVMNAKGSYDMTSVQKTGKTGADGEASFSFGKGFELNNDKSVLSGKIAGDGSLVLKVYIDRSKYTLTTVIDGVETKTEYIYGAAVTAPEIPAKDGHTGVWTPAIPSTMPAENIGSTAGWEINEYTVKYLISDSATDAFEEYEVEYGAAIPVPSETPTKNGYHFMGWSPAAPEAMPAEDLTFVAQWQEKVDCTVVFDANGGAFDDGSTEQTKTIKFGDAVTAPTDKPDKAGNFRFIGWSTDKNATAAEELGTLLNTEGETYYAVYEAAICVVSYWVDGVEIENYRSTFTANGTETVKAEPKKTGYTFSGWSINGEEVVEDVITIEVKEQTAVKIEGTFTANNYNVTFNAGAGAFEDGATKKTVSFAYNETIEFPADPAPTDENYVFVGWASSKTATEAGEFTTLEALGNAKTLNLYAVYVENSFTVTYIVNLNGAKEIEETFAVEMGDKKADKYSYEVPYRTGYTVSAWDKEVPEEITVDNYDNLTFTASYEPKSYNISFISVSGYAPMTLKFGEEITLPADPTKEGHTFAGWTWKGMTESGIYVDVEPQATMPAYNINLIPNWTVNEYNVIFNAAGGTIEGETEFKVEYGAAIDAPADPAKDGYTFAGWSPEVPSAMPAEDMTFTAQWTVNQYTITFDTDGGTAVAPITQDCYSDIATPAEPTKTGYTFAGWSPAIPATMPAEDMTVVAQWTKNQYTITFVDTGDVAYEAITRDYDAEVGDIAAPVKEGHTFKDWDKEIPKKMPAEDTTITALWEVNSYDVYFYEESLEGKPVGDPVVLPNVYGEAISNVAEFTKEGHSLSWIWYEKDENGEFVEIIDAPETMLAKTLYALAAWDVNTYTVTWDNGGETTEEPYKYGAVITKLADPEDKKGYTFEAWEGYTDEMTMPAEDITFTAIWKADTFDAVFDAAGGTFADGSATCTVPTEFDKAIEAPADPVCEGKTFTGWTPAVGNMTEEGMPFTATWTSNVYNATFTVDGEIYDIAEGLTFGQKIDKPEDPAKEGYVFEGWSTDGQTILAELGTMPVGGITFKAVFSKATDTKYTVELYYEKTEYNKETEEGFNEVADETLVKTDGVTGESVTYAPEAKEGFITPEAVSGTVAADGSTVLKVYYYRNSYTLTVNVIVDGKVDAELSSEMDYVFESSIAEPADPVKEGYTFNEWTWKNADTGEVLSAPETAMPAYNIVIETELEQNTYYIYFSSHANGWGAEPVEGHFGDSVTAPSTDVTGYTFLYWSETPDGEKYEFPATMPSKDLTLYAVFEGPNSYDAVFNANGGAFADGSSTYTASTVFGSEIVAPADPVREGFVFAGWTTEDGISTEVMDAEGKTLVAEWTAA